MNRDDIYDHLARVYLGKRKEVSIKQKKQFNVWLLINVLITALIFASSFYGLTAFLTHRQAFLKSTIIFTLNNGPMRIEYNFHSDFTPVKSLVLGVPPMDVSRYSQIHFSIRAREEGSPGVIKVILRNKRNEIGYRYIQGIDLKWKEYSIPLEEFVNNISDWNSLVDVSFVLESWNVLKDKGAVLIDNVHFST